jgi:hypothetical protein
MFFSNEQHIFIVKVKGDNSSAIASGGDIFTRQFRIHLEISIPQFRRL